MNQNRIVEQQIGSFLVYIANIGIVWFFAWVFNPNIDSGLVWMIAVLYGAIMSRFYTIEERLK